MMIYIVYTLCMIDNPSMCKEIIEPYAPDNKTTAASCMMNGMLKGAMMLEAHPKWVITKFNCTKVAQANL